MKRILFVTVGSTKFDELIESISKANSDGSFESFIKTFKIDQIIVQHGGSPAPTIKSYPHTQIEIKTYIEPKRMSELLSSSTVIISHGGAGTIFEILRNKSLELESLIIVENGALMDSHQAELIDALIDINCPLQRADSKNIFKTDFICKKEDIQAFNLPVPNYKPLTNLINSWL